MVYLLVIVMISPMGSRMLRQPFPSLEACERAKPVMVAHMQHLGGDQLFSAKCELSEQRI